MTTDVLRLFPDVLLGREAELTTLLSEYDEACRLARARVLFVRGPRGVGKSHLVAGLGQALRQRGVCVLEGGSGRDRPGAWGLVSPLVTGLLEQASRAGDVSEPTLARLAALVAPLQGQGTVAERLPVFDALGQLLGLVCLRRPVIVLPDLDAADGSSLELVRYLLALVSAPSFRQGVLFVATLRDDAPLSPLVSQLLERVSARTLCLAGLDLEGIRQFLRQPSVARRLLEVTGGNPDALGELLARPLPPVDFFLKRLEGLPPPQRAVLELLAVAPGGVAVGVIARALSVPVEVAARALDALVALRLVRARVVDAKATWHAAREQDQLSLAAHLQPLARTALTLALGRALGEVGEVALAAEVLAVEAPVEAAAHGLEAASGLLARGALEDGCRLLQRGHALLLGPARARSAEAWARAASLLGDWRTAARRALEAARLARQPGQAPVPVDDLLLLAAQALARTGRPLRASAVLGALRGSGLARRAQALLAQLSLGKGALEEATRAARALVAGDDEAAVEARQVLGKVLLQRGQAHDARGEFHLAWQLATALGLPALAARAQLNEGVAAFSQGERLHAIACWEACTQLEDRACSAHALANLGSAWAEVGDFEPALAALTRALDAFSRFGAPREVGLASSNLARLLHELGDLERASELAQHALERGAELGDAWLEASARLTLGAVRVDQGALAGAVGLLETARDGFVRLGNEGFSALAVGVKARAHLLAGERGQAEVELARSCVEPGSKSLVAAGLEVELARGELCLSAGDLLGATRSLGRARDALLHQPSLDGPPRAHLLAARLRAAAADTVGAQLELQRGARALEVMAQRVPLARRAQYLALPWRAQLLAGVDPAVTHTVVAAPSRPGTERAHGLVGRSAALQRITRQLEPVGRSSATVLVRGESGTGKELLAEALHALSARRHMPLVKVNCAAMVEELLLSELFGHEKGAFTGAVRERKGRFELADGGSIFLDEIGDISPRAQVALLRVLQEREFERVGGSKTLKVDVRVICATNRDLETLMSQGRFRADLYFRLKGVMLELPPLRARLEDLGPLAQAMLDRLTQRGEPRRWLSAEALDLLGRHPWPGNVRELENVVSTAAIFAEGPVLTPEAFAHVAELAALMQAPADAVAPAREQPVASPAPPPQSTGATPAPPPTDWFGLARARDLSLKDLRREVELQCIRRALGEASGNISEAARLLKMKRSRLSQIVNAEAALKELAHGE